MDLGSGIRDPEKTYFGSRIQGSKRHRIPDPDPQHWSARNVVKNKPKLFKLYTVSILARIKAIRIKEFNYLLTEKIVS
jgi:hypothetical protein